jgi:hypothetical protein
MDDPVTETPAPLPPDVMARSESPSSRDLPLHLRVLEAIVADRNEQEGLQQALELAHEIYELETANIALEDYRSAS